MRAVLFDLDGTLLDTAADLGAATNHVLQQYQLPEITLKAARQLSSHGALGLLRHGFGEQFEQLDQGALRQQLLDYYNENICVHTDFFAGVKPALSWLEQQGIAWGVVTNKPEGLTLRLLQYFSEFERCGVVIGGDSLAKRKPDPLPINHAAERLNAAAERSIYVGDAERDIEAGRRAGMTTLLADWGYISPEDDTDSWQADWRCARSEQLQQTLQQIMTKM